jgi:site-specific DNA-methyltransferase (cytosine-N4-specific)
MKSLLKNGYRAKKRPSGHDISTKFNIDNKASIPPNLLAVPNTESNSYYMRYCKEKGLPQHPARFPSEIPEFFIRMLTDPKELVFDPFAGSCVTGEVAERLKRNWICCDNVEEYLAGALGRFDNGQATLFPDMPENMQTKEIFYKIYHPSAMWNRLEDDLLPEDGGLNRRISTSGKYPDSDSKDQTGSVGERRSTYGGKLKQKGNKKKNESRNLKKRKMV